MELISPIPRRPVRVPNARIGLLMTGLIVAAIALLGARSIEWFILEQSLRHRSEDEMDHHGATGRLADGQTAAAAGLVRVKSLLG